MELDQAKAADIAQRYFRTTSLLTSLGWGISGFVFLSPDLRTAVKVHRHREGFDRELDAYLRLRSLNITQLHGLTIPKLRGFRTEDKLIRMDFVKAPYLLDFAGVSFDPPDFPDDTTEAWHTSIVTAYGPNAHVAYAVYHSLSLHEIYYLDFRPSNLNLTGLPGLIEWDESEDPST